MLATALEAIDALDVVFLSVDAIERRTAWLTYPPSVAWGSSSCSPTARARCRSAKSPSDLNLPKSGAHRLLATLVDLGWAEQDRETGFYRLTMRLAMLGQRFYVATGMPDICQPLLDRLAHDCREFARLAVVDGSSLVWIAHAQGAIGGLMYQPSVTTDTVPLYATASGKAWLATLKVNEAVQHVAKRRLQSTPTDTGRT